MYSKRLKLGPIDLRISMDDQPAERIRNSRVYRYLVRPVLKSMARSDNATGKTGNSTSVHQPVKDQAVSYSEDNPYSGTPEQESILERISGIKWYHTIDLGYGVVTPGNHDYRSQLSEYKLPERFDSKRILEVASYDGFWAFEFEKRGAEEVLAIDIESYDDIDLPPKVKAGIPKEILERKLATGFEIAKDILKSKVKRQVLSVYNLSAERLGKFDVVFSSDVLLHLVNPMKALQNIYSVVTDYAIIVEPFSYDLEGIHQENDLIHYRGGRNKCVWWGFSLGSLKQLITDAGFRKAELVNTFSFGYRGEEEKYWHAVYRAYR